MSRGGRGAGVKREATNQPQVANQAQFDIIDPNHIKNETDGENNEVTVTYENHPRTQEAIEAAEEMTKLIMMKEKKRRLEEEQQALDAKIEEQKARVLAKI